MMLPSLAPICCCLRWGEIVFECYGRFCIFQPDSCEIVLNCCSGSCCCFCVSARCLRLDYTEASATHPNSGGAERLQRSFQITGSETQKWISSSEMKTEAGVESFPKCLCPTVCLFQPFLSYAFCEKLLILLHKHRKWKKHEDIGRCVNWSFGVACCFFLQNLKMARLIHFSIAAV